MQEILREMSYAEAGEKFRGLLISLYEKKIFPRQGKVFADELFQAGASAGAYVYNLGDAKEAHYKRDVAQLALTELNRVAYLLKIMQEGGFYTEIEVVPLLEYTQKLIAAVKDVLSNVYAYINTEAAKPVVNSMYTAFSAGSEAAIAAPCTEKK